MSQVHLLQGQRLRALERRGADISAAAKVIADVTATAEQKASARAARAQIEETFASDPTILSKQFFMNQFYHKLLRHAFLPEHARFNNKAKQLSFCDADYVAIQKLLALIAPAVSAEQDASADKLSAKNSERAVELVDAGYIHMSFFRFQDTTLYTDDVPEGVRCIVVRGSVIASMNSTHYAVRILFTQNTHGQWEATKQLKNCQCVSGSELEKLWCTHMAGAFVALAKLVRNRKRPLERVKATWPEDIVLLQAQPVRLSLVVGFRAFGRGLLTKRANDIEDDASSDGTDEEEEEENDEEQEQDEEEQEEGVGEDAQQDEGEGGGGGAAGARPRSRRPRRRTIDPSGAKSLTKKEVDADLAEYLSGELGRLMLRRHNGVLRRYHASPMDPTLNTNLNNYRPSACEQ